MSGDGQPGGPATDRSDDPTVGITIRTRWVRRLVVTGAVLLGLGHMAFTVPDTPLTKFFDLDRESGLGTWYSSFLFVSAAATAALVAVARRPARLFYGFAALAGVLLLLGIEEVAAFHERASKHVATAADVGGGFSGGTPLIGFALLPFGAYALMVLTQGCRLAVRRLVLWGATVWFLGAFVTEQIEAWNVEGMFLSIGSVQFLHAIIAGCQESAEMLGVALVLCGLLEELAGDPRGVILRFRSGS